MAAGTQLSGADILAMSVAKTPIKPEECAKRYPEALLIATRVAREMGYAIAVHGSRVRDLDLIAVPWVADAKPAIELVKSLELALCGYITERTSEGALWPVEKPHGRRAWSIHLGGGPYVDLSVMPTVGQATHVVVDAVCEHCDASEAHASSEPLAAHPTPSPLLGPSHA